MTEKVIISACGVLALLILAFCIALIVRFRKNMKNIVRIAAVGVFLMLVALLYPYYYIQGEPYAIGLTLVESMCAMLLNSSPGDILSGFNGYSVVFLNAYKGFLLILLIVAPLFTVGITLSFFSDKFNRIIYRIRSTMHESFIFSAINERALCIAEDIARSDPKAVIVFCVRVSKDDVDGESLARMKKIKAYLINEDVVELGHSPNKPCNYYLLSRDVSENLETGLRMYKEYNEDDMSGEVTGKKNKKKKTSDNINMWLYTRGELAEIIFDYLYESFNVRLINEEVLIAKRLLNEHPLYDAVKDNRLSVLVVGCGHIGLEILRSICVCSSLGENVSVEINVVDMDGEKAREIFEKRCPKLAERLNINFHSADVTTLSLRRVLEKLSPTYITVALGNETLDLETAVYIRRFYGQSGGFPLLHALIDHKDIEDNVLGNLCVADWTYNGSENIRKYEKKEEGRFDILPFGSYEDTYKDLRLTADYLDLLSIAVNARYRRVSSVENIPIKELLDLYNQVPFYKEYSDAFALSIPYKLWMMGLCLVEDGKGDLSALKDCLTQHHDMLRQHETDRYEYFMRGMGWSLKPLAEMTDKKLSDKLRKRHARIGNEYMKELSEITGRDLDTEDRESVMSLPIILEMANQLCRDKTKIRSVRRIEKK